MVKEWEILFFWVLLYVPTCGRQGNILSMDRRAFMTPHFLHYHRSLFCLFSGIHLSLAHTCGMCAATMVGGAWEFFLPTGRQAGVFWEFLYRWEFCSALIISASAAFFVPNYFFKNGSFFGLPCRCGNHIYKFAKKDQRQ